MKKVFLGGTCNESTWRNDLIKILKIDYIYVGFTTITRFSKSK